MLNNAVTSFASLMSISQLAGACFQHPIADLKQQMSAGSHWNVLAVVPPLGRTERHDCITVASSSDEERLGRVRQLEFKQPVMCLLHAGSGRS